MARPRNVLSGSLNTECACLTAIDQKVHSTTSGLMWSGEFSTLVFRTSLMPLRYSSMWFQFLCKDIYRKYYVALAPVMLQYCPNYSKTFSAISVAKAFRTKQWYVFFALLKWRKYLRVSFCVENTHSKQAGKTVVLWSFYPVYEALFHLVQSWAQLESQKSFFILVSSCNGQNTHTHTQCVVWHAGEISENRKRLYHGKFEAKIQRVIWKHCPKSWLYSWGHCTQQMIMWRLCKKYSTLVPSTHERECKFSQQESQYYLVSPRLMTQVMQVSAFMLFVCCQYKLSTLVYCCV